MTRATFNPKTLLAEPSGAASAKKEPSEGAEKKGAGKSLSAGFSRAEPKQWKRLTNGTPSEIGPLVEELHGEPSGAARPMSREAAMQELLSMFTFGDRGGSEEKPTAKDLDIPPIPKMEDLLKMPGVFDNVKPVVDRFLALEKTYVLLLRETRRSIRKGDMHDDEVKNRQLQEKHLIRGLAEVRRELSEARYYYEWQKLRDKAAKAEAKDEFDRIP